MAQWHVPLADVVVPEDDIAAVVDVYRSGWLSMGPQTEELEAQLAAYTGARHALAVANCTVGLHLMCVVAGFGPGDEVIVPSLTFVASVNAIRYTGATPVFADIEGLDAPWLSAEAAEAAVTDRTRGIMAMAYGGHPGRDRGAAGARAAARARAARGRCPRCGHASSTAATPARSAAPAASASSRTRTSRSARAARS